MGKVYLNKSRSSILLTTIVIFSLFFFFANNAIGASQEDINYKNNTNIKLINLRLNKNEPSVGDEVIITAEVQNIDIKNATNFSIILKLNEIIIDSKHIDIIKPGNKISINLTWIPEKAGEYKPDIKFEGNVHYYDKETIYTPIIVKD